MLPWRKVGDTEVIAPYDRLLRDVEVKAAGRGLFLRAAMSIFPFSGARIVSDCRLAATMFGDVEARANVPKVLERSSVVDSLLDPG